MDPLAFYMLPILALIGLPVPLAIVRRFLALALCLSLGFCATADREPVPVVDPAGLSVPLTTFAVVPF